MRHVECSVLVEPDGRTLVVQCRTHGRVRRRLGDRRAVDLLPSALEELRGRGCSHPVSPYMQQPPP